MAETVATEAAPAAAATPAVTETAPAPPPAPAETVAPPADGPAPEQAKTSDTAASLLSDAAKPKDEAPSADKAAQPETEGEKDEKAPDASASAEASPLIVYEPWKAPEGITLDEQTVKPFNDLLATAKVPQEVGQQLVDMHFAQVQSLREALAEQQRQTWSDARSGWIDAVKADPELGGSRFETALHTCGQVIEEYGGTREQQEELRQVLALTGAGDHPAVVRFVHNIGKARAAPRPVPATQPVPQPQTRAQRRYAGSLNGATAQ